jgi:hypothetical protein
VQGMTIPEAVTRKKLKLCSPNTAMLIARRIIGRNTKSSVHNVLQSCTMDYLKNDDAMVHCCADCGGVAGEGISLKACKACMLAKYCNADCQKNHWPKHKIECKQRAAELRDEALFKDPPAKEECPICFLPMPILLISCVSLPPATIKSVPVYDYAETNEVVANEDMEHYFSCCGKYVCGGCIYSFNESGNVGTCPFCKSEIVGKTNEEHTKELMKRVEAKDANAICHLANHYYFGNMGLQQDRAKAIELWKQAAKLGSGKAHCCLGNEYSQ